MSIKSLFEDIAEAIREKSGSSDTYTPAEMPSAIRSIPSGSSTASGVSYDNTSSGLTASNVQDAIDELSGDVSTINSDLSELGFKKILSVQLNDTNVTANTITEIPITVSEGQVVGGVISSVNSVGTSDNFTSNANFRIVNGQPKVYLVTSVTGLYRVYCIVFVK